MSIKYVILTALFDVKNYLSNGWIPYSMTPLSPYYPNFLAHFYKKYKKIAWLSHKFFVRWVYWEVRPTLSTREIGAVSLNYFKKNGNNSKKALTLSNICRIFQYEVDDVFNWFDDLFVFRIQLCSWVWEEIPRQNDTQAKQNRRRNINNKGV